MTYEAETFEGLKAVLTEKRNRILEIERESNQLAQDAAKFIYTFLQGRDLEVDASCNKASVAGKKVVLSSVRPEIKYHWYASLIVNEIKDDGSISGRSTIIPLRDIIFDGQRLKI